jgi:hypothetical protein
MTRILTSLRLLGLEEYAQALFTCLDEIYQNYSQEIGDRTYCYWEDAVS